MTTLFKVEMLPARHGDCLWVEYGTDASPKTILIDGGPGHAYDALRARAAAMTQRPRALQLLVVTHIDSDHIQGAVTLLGDEELGLQFGDIWFNGWPQICGPLPDPPPPPPPPPEPRDGSDRSAVESLFLQTRLEPWQGMWNRQFAKQAIMVYPGRRLPRFEFDDKLVITLLSPTREKLEKLRDAMDKSIRAAGGSPGDQDFIDRKLAKFAYRDGEPLPADGAHARVQAVPEIARKIDAAVANGSSIAFVAEYGGKRCAFLGDAHISVLEESIERMAKENRTRKLPLDAVKLSHHGSEGNISSDFLRWIDCRDFLVSTDGSQFGHPDVAAIELLIAEVPGVRLHFNYLCPHTEKWNDAADQKNRNYRAIFPCTSAQGLTVDLMNPGCP